MYSKVYIYGDFYDRREIMTNFNIFLYFLEFSVSVSVILTNEGVQPYLQSLFLLFQTLVLALQ